jgi:hypothetical protein
VRAVLRLYGPGEAEVGWSHMPVRAPGSGGRRGSSVNAEVNLDRALRRARSVVRRKVMSARLDHLLTLTYRDNVVDLARAWEDWRRFVRSVRDSFPGGWTYVVVAERQARGAVHFHAAVRGFQKVRLLRSLWLRVVGEGNIDVRAPGRGAAWKGHRLARYLAKYVGKTMSSRSALGEHRFRASLGLCVTEERRVFESEEAALWWLAAEGGCVSFIWRDLSGRVGWACSWG